MERQRREGLVGKDRIIALGVAVCLGLLVWGVLQALGGTNSVRRGPLQAPARQEPGEHTRPNLDPEPLAKRLQSAYRAPV